MDAGSDGQAVSVGSSNTSKVISISPNLDTRFALASGPVVNKVPLGDQVRFLVKNSSSLSNGIRSVLSYRSTWPAPGTTWSSFGSAASS